MSFTHLSKVLPGCALQSRDIQCIYGEEAPMSTVHCKLDKVGHRSLCPPRNGTGVLLLEASLCRVNLKEMCGSSYLSPYSKMSKIVQLLLSCCIPDGGAGPPHFFSRKSFSSCTPGTGPPDCMDFVVGDMLCTSQCIQSPTGASGSLQIRAKLLVPAGT